MSESPRRHGARAQEAGQAAEERAQGVATGPQEPGRKCSDYFLPSGWQEAGSEGPDKEDGVELLNVGGEKRSKERGRSSKTRKGDWAAVRTRTVYRITTSPVQINHSHHFLIGNQRRPCGRKHHALV